jgi:hypothetical protein
VRRWDTVKTMSPVAQARAYLHGARNPDGSLGHLPGQPGHLEPTLLAAAAGALPPPLDWLKGQPWGWGHLLLPACLADFPTARPLLDDTVETMLSIQGEHVPDPDGLLGFDTALAAWPWIDGTAPWVEPTAYAVLSLKRAGLAAHPRAIQGQALLLDRQCSDGGWNYGNPAVLGVELESYLPPTGWVTLALPAGPAVERGLTRLDSARQQTSTTTLSLAILAARQHGRPTDELATMLRARQRTDGSFSGRCDWTALAACALSDDPHPFSLSVTP